MKNGKIYVILAKNAEYVPYGNPVPGELNMQMVNGRPQVLGYDFMSTVQGMDMYVPPTGQDYIQDKV